MELLEMVKPALDKAIDAKCPFKTPNPPKVKKQKENIANDDRRKVSKIQANSGGKLGSNLTDASPGDPGTFNDLPSAPPRAIKTPAVDTKRNNGGKVTVDGEEYPYGVAAHHLIPGEASLVKSTLYKRYMVKGGKGKRSSGKPFKIMQHIGYNVNGAHNGVWLPGNYAIRKKTSPKKNVSWGKLGPEWDDWCTDYMFACIRKAKGQFHDAHVGYNTKMLGVLNSLERAMLAHQDACTECKGDEVPPPYVLKDTLYSISRKVKGRLRTVGGTAWVLPWCTSDRFKAALIKAKKIGPGTG